MQVEESKTDPWTGKTEAESEVRGFLSSAYDFLTSLLMGCIGLVVFAVCIFTVFRNGAWLADISFVEWLLSFWILYCFYAIKTLAVEQNRSVFLFRWRLFAFTGWTSFWVAVAYSAWFKLGSDSGWEVTFLASNLFEVSLLLVVGLGMGLGLLVSVDKEDKPAQGAVSGEAS